MVTTGGGVTAAGANSDGQRELKDIFVPKQTDDVTVFWSRATLVATLVAGLLGIGCEAWIMVAENILKNKLLEDVYDDMVWRNFQVSETYHSVFLSGFVFLLAVVWDGVMHKNLMQVLSVNVYNVGLLVYSILQIVQVNNDLSFLRDSLESTYWDDASNKGYFLAAQILLPVILGLFIPLFAYLTYRLHFEFGWRIYRVTGGSIQLEKVFFNYHILLLLLKFSVFFVFGFTVLDLVLTIVSDNGKFFIAIGAAVLGIVIPTLGFYGARKENRPLLILYSLGCLVVLGYLIQRVWQAFYKAGQISSDTESQKSNDFRRAVMPFLLYAIISFILAFSALVYGFVCAKSFNLGLKEVLDQEAKRKKGELAAAVVDLDA